MDHKHGVRVVLKPLAHLLAISSKNQAIGNEVLEGGLVEQGSGEHDEGVEPTSGLVNTLGNEVGGEGLLEGFLVLEGVVTLGVRHAIGQKHEH